MDGEYLKQSALRLMGYCVSVGIFIGLLALCFTHVHKVECVQIGQQTGLPTKYRLPSGCYIKDGPRWMQLVRYNALKDMKNVSKNDR